MDLSCKESFYRSKSIKNSNYSRITPRPVRPVGLTGQAGWASAKHATTLDRSDRLVRSVRPVSANFGGQHTSCTISISECVPGYVNKDLHKQNGRSAILWMGTKHMFGLWSDKVIASRFYYSSYGWIVLSSTHVVLEREIV